MAKMHTHTQRGATMRFFCETSLPFYFVLAGWKSFWVYNFLNTHTILVVPSSALHCMWICLLACHPHNFHGTLAEEYLHPVYFRKLVDILLCNLRSISAGSIVLFTLGNRCTSSYATHTTFAACQKNLSVAIQQALQSIFTKKKNHLSVKSKNWNLQGLTKMY